MLELLRIQNYALIDSIDLEFTGGFNVLTGETGAGKSIIVGALNLILGGRASSETVREGAKQAKVEAIFRLGRNTASVIECCRAHDIEIDDNELLVSRVVTADGRSRAYVAGNLVPIGVLAELGDELVDMHGQHEHQSLLRLDRQLELLDSFAQAGEAAAAVAAHVQRLRRLDQSIEELSSHDRERERRLEFLRFEVDEIDAAGLSPGEEEELRARRNLITNAEKIVSLASAVSQALYEGEGNAAIDGVDRGLTALEELSEIDPRFKPFAEQLLSVRSIIDETAKDVRAFSDAIDFDNSELDSLNLRLNAIGALKRKYGDTTDAVLEYARRAREEILQFEQRDQRLDELRLEQATVLKQAETEARALSAKRREAAARLDKEVTRALQDLGMKGGRFETQLETEPLSARGVDKVQFLLSANPGEKPKSLKQVASGGEVSRVMLALKSVFAAADRIPTLIFDEIDAGVGGAVATKVAEKLRKLSKTHQAICITHLPQIAAMATTHYHVAKATYKNRTATTVAKVEADKRVEEVARLLDGSLTEVSLEHARSLLQAK